jgi:hypothetical protein
VVLVGAVVVLGMVLQALPVLLVVSLVTQQCLRAVVVLTVPQVPQVLLAQPVPQELTSVLRGLVEVVVEPVVQAMAVMVVLAALVVEVVVEAAVLPLMLLVLAVMVAGVGFVLSLGKE